MNLSLSRTQYSPNSTIGVLRINSDYVCFTLEEPAGDGRGSAGNCILPGIYQVVITYSLRLERDMPLLCNVPNRQGIRIHWGNTASDTEGCILVGKTAATDFIGNSRDAFNIIYQKIAVRIQTGEPVQVNIS
jgi:hypothetical protein